jgi:hypothetical protein
MSVVLGSTWRPRGELARFRKYLAMLREVYTGIRLVLPPVEEIEPQASETLWELGFELEWRSAVQSQGQAVELLAASTPDWSWGRHLALQQALEVPAEHIQYADFDRLLRWVETRPEEWRETVAAIPAWDCLIIGRTPAAYRTHPQALIQTEAISNRVVSYLVGKDMDVSAGSKGFSRAAVEFLLANSQPGHALGTDGEWPVILHRAGFSIEWVAVDGLDWESADRYRDRAADLHSQRSAAEAYDADPANWAHRVQVALEIVQYAQGASERTLEKT